MLASKLSISLDTHSLLLLNRVQQDYDCANRSQAVAQVLKLYQQMVDQRMLEAAYAASSAQDAAMDAHFSSSNNDGLAHEAW